MSEVVFSITSPQAYDVAAFIFSDPNVQEKAEDQVPTEIIAGVTCAIIVVLVIVVAFIGYRFVMCRGFVL